MDESKKRQAGKLAALLTPLFMGLAPIFAKFAIRSGLDAYTLTALRTCFAAALMWVVYLLFFRRFIFIFPAGLLGALVVGAVNGLGSLLYYNGLLLLDDASLAQLLNMTYIIFVMLLTGVSGHRISLKDILRGVLAFGGVYLLTNFHAASNNDMVHWIGVGLMLGGAFLYALHVVISQRVMYEMPAPTMALYAMTFMGLTVLIARVIVGVPYHLSWSPVIEQGWLFIAALAVVTALSRVTLFAGVRSLGSLQTLFLNMAELSVTLLAGYFWLGERMTTTQWIGVVILSASVLVRLDEPKSAPPSPREAEAERAARLLREAGFDPSDLPTSVGRELGSPPKGVSEANSTVDIELQSTRLEPSQD